ncbi:DUF1707 domain-containing protein [Nocardia zapadnayensis]|uniref:DUF1707 SHOCT-like domain-containing protein n=1 Tax=Nocardia rhamnosiphila TaxID=426716 RepID=UPI00224596DC|nr:DUF1707 domain-containing protein [Nocardia zapadnayensis]MCX0271982.1 DUF1707 domain-containing protein [Nocardia zapadnayensis]
MEITTGTRASDAERDRIVRELSRHLGDGRIDLAEYDQRVAQVYRTTTREELTGVLADLPTLAPARPATPRSRFPIWQRIEATAWLTVSVLVLVIWGAISLGVGEFTYFWPIWVIGPWGAVLAVRAATGLESGHRYRRKI